MATKRIQSKRHATDKRIKLARIQNMKLQVDPGELLEIECFFNYTMVKDWVLPVIRRRNGDQKLDLIPLRIVLYVVFGKKRADFMDHDEIIECIAMPMYKINKNEANFLDRLNVGIKKCAYGFEPFESGDKAMKICDMKDCVEFFEFVKSHYRKNEPDASLDMRAGLITKHVVTMKNVMPFLRLFGGYGDIYVPYCILKPHVTKKLKKKDVLTIKGWDLTYFQFCCKLVNMPKTYSSDKVVPVELWYSGNDVAAAYIGDLVKVLLCNESEYEEWMLESDDEAGV